MTTTAEAAFGRELEIFRKEEETAQQHFFAYLSLREFAASNNDVLKAMNTTPLFSLTTHHAMLLSAFIGLSRIFDQSSAHNIDTLMASASKDLGVFSKAALAKRKMAAGLTGNDASAYVNDAFEPTPHDFRALGSRKLEEVSGASIVKRTGPTNGANVYFHLSLTAGPIRRCYPAFRRSQATDIAPVL